ncbi:MAG: hypothetical protein ACE5H1_11670 [Thermodesulfobacteriota bacterium]
MKHITEKRIQAQKPAIFVLIIMGNQYQDHIEKLYIPVNPWLTVKNSQTESVILPAE